MPTRNEADRYLTQALQAVSPLVDAVFVFDDQSTDATIDVARGLGAVVCRRTDVIPAFLEHEGKFRQGAWEAFCQRMNPEVGDWVLAVDADEIVMGDRIQLEEAAGSGHLARWVRIPEVFAVEDDVPLVRTDGWWGTIRGSRFFAYQPNGRFTDKPMGCGSEPTYIQGRVGPLIPEFSLVHFGYAKEEDRRTKYARYSGRSGHSDRHVESILAVPTLVPFH